MFKCIGLLGENQRAAVKKMGFEQMLLLKVSSVPHTLGHYVVDKFNPEKKRIELPNGNIPIDKDAIHELLGIPCVGEDIYSGEMFDPQEVVREWKKRYNGRFVARTIIVQNIEKADDEDTFNFRLDFVMLFLATMVHCHNQGRCRESILDYIHVETDFSKIDWCDHVLRELKVCKHSWRRYDKSAVFTGPLTLLVLMYVEYVECDAIRRGDNLKAITFWNKKKLRMRERWELNNGGFGNGNVKSLSKVALPSLKVGNQQDDMKEKEIMEMRRMVESTLAYKKYMETKLLTLYRNDKNNADVIKLKEDYMSLLEQRPSWDDEEDAVSRIKNVLLNLADQEKEDEEGMKGTSEQTMNDEDGQICLDADETCEQNVTNLESAEGPNWSLGVSQIGLNMEHTVNEERADNEERRDEEATEEIDSEKTESIDGLGGSMHREHSMSEIGEGTKKKSKKDVDKMIQFCEEEVMEPQKGNEEGKKIADIAIVSIEVLGGQGEVPINNVENNISGDVEAGIKTNDVFNTAFVPLSSLLDEQKHKMKEAIQIMENKRIKPVRQIPIASVNRSPYQIRPVDITGAVSKEEERLWSFLFEDESLIF